MTQNEMTVTQVYTTDGRVAEVTGVGYNARGEVLYSSTEVALPYSHPLLTKLAQVSLTIGSVFVSQKSLKT